MIRLIRFGVAVFFVAAASAASAPQKPAPPTGKELEALTREVASQLRCPVCRQLSVQDSQAELSKEVRGLIKERLAAGESPEEVKAYFVSKYGEWILLSPPKKGITLLVWVLPLAAFAGGGAVLALFFKRWLGSSEERERGFTSVSGSLQAADDNVQVR